MKVCKILAFVAVVVVTGVDDLALRAALERSVVGAVDVVVRQHSLARACASPFVGADGAFWEVVLQVDVCAIISMFDNGFAGEAAAAVSGLLEREVVGDSFGVDFAVSVDRRRIRGGLASFDDKHGFEDGVEHCGE